MVCRPQQAVERTFEPKARSGDCRRGMNDASARDASTYQKKISEIMNMIRAIA
jgi:hypothetical protein